jgi:phage terminase small subunit
VGVLKNPKHELFAQELAKGKTQLEAYEAAGYKPNDSAAARLCGNVRVTERIAELLEGAAAKTGITIERVLNELALLGFSNMADYMRVGSNGDPMLDFSKITRDQAAALTEVTVEDFVDGRGEDARDVRRVKFKLADKRAALVDIGKTLGMFKDRIEHSGKDGGPITFQNVYE